jgi:hypothetical protein
MSEKGQYLPTSDVCVTSVQPPNNGLMSDIGSGPEAEVIKPTRRRLASEPTLNCFSLTGHSSCQ